MIILEHQRTFLFTFSIVAMSGGEFGQNGAFKKGDVWIFWLKLQTFNLTMFIFATFTKLHLCAVLAALATRLYLLHRILGKLHIATLLCNKGVHPGAFKNISSVLKYVF
jgi:hypothetical protein